MFYFIKTLKCFLLKLDELSWNLIGDYPRIILDVIQDLVRGRIYFVNFRKNTMQTKKNFLHSNFLKIYFHNKGIELIQLNKLLKKVNPCIPRSFSNTNNPTIIYKRSPTIACKIFNYSKVIKSININEWKNDESCTCKTSSFCDPHHKHIVTGDLKIIENRDLRHLLMKGPNYREPCVINWNKVVSCIIAGVTECQKDWARKENVDRAVLNEWSGSLLNLVRNRVNKLKKLNRFRYSSKKSILNKPEIRKYLQELHDRYVFVPTDKASNNIAVICKYYYIKVLLKEIGLFDNKQKSAYISISENSQAIITQHVKNMEEVKLNIEEKKQQLPILLWIPKMHKKPSKQRFIAASHCCTTKPISALITKCLKLIQQAHKIYCDRIKSFTGFNFFWIIDNSMEVHKLLQNSTKNKPRNVITYDFSTLYTSIPHVKLKEEIKLLVEKAYNGMNKKFIKVTKSRAYWSNSKTTHTLAVTCNELTHMIEWLIDNTYVIVGNQVLRQTIGIPMGTDCAPFLANLFLFSYEFRYLNNLLKQRNFTVLNKFRRCARYIDDVLLINNDNFLKSHKHDIYPKELDLTSDDKDDQQVHFLDLDILIVGKGFSYKIYDKRDNFDFPIVNYPDLSGNIPSRQSYSVFISQLVRYARGCLHFKDFQLRCISLTSKLLAQNFKLDRLRFAFFKFCLRHKNLILKYGNKPFVLDTGLG